MQFKASLSWNRIFFIFILILLFVGITGCASVPERNPLPDDFKGMAEIPGYSVVRAWGDEFSKYDEIFYARTDEELKARYSGIIGREQNILAISGGGGDGAFGAGLLVGWSAAGTRPEFSMVTGISTGALMAPFAFLGPAYDDTLKKVYTTLSTKDLIKERGLLATVTGDSAASTEPLKAKIAEYIDLKVIDAIAAEHRRGRRLFIGTTDLDAGRPITWDVGKIAASGNPNRLELIHKVILASASIPGLFPPVIFEVEHNGERFDEMHVDGGAANQVFLYPIDLDLDITLERLNAKGRPNIYMIRNSQLYPSRRAVDRKLFPIVGRSVSSLIRTQGLGDILKVAMLARRDNLNYYLAFIPDEFDQKEKEAFDPDYMGKLFDLGYRMAKEGDPWYDVLGVLELLEIEKAEVSTQ